jgi:hypothetical protein
LGRSNKKTEDKVKKLLSCVFVIVVLFTLGYTVSAADTAAADEAKNKNFVLIFWGYEYNAKIADTVEFFFKNMLKPEDQLSILTPVKPYNYSGETRQKQTTEKLIEMTQTILKRDFAVGGANYKQIVESMAQLITEINGGGDQSDMAASEPGMQASTTPGSTNMKTYLTQYLQLRREMINQRRISEKLFLDLAAFFKKKEGKDIMYIFFQGESQYIPTRQVMEALRKDPKVRFKSVEAFDEENTKKIMDVDKVAAALKDAAVTLNFIYIKPKERRRQGMELRDHSNDVYGVFSRLAKETGGELVATAKPEAALKKMAK